MRHEISLLVKKFEEANTSYGKAVAIQMLYSVQLNREEVNSLAQHSLPDLRCRVASSSLLSSKNIFALSLDTNALIRANLARNPKKIPRKILWRLSNDNEQTVRQGIAGRRPLAKKLFIHLVKDPDHSAITALTRDRLIPLPKDIAYALYGSEMGHPSANQDLALEIERDQNMIGLPLYLLG